MPAAFDPPPTQATTASGSRPIWSRHCAAFPGRSPTESRAQSSETGAGRPRSRWCNASFRRAHPVAHRLVGRVAKVREPVVTGTHVGAQRLHVEDVELLAADVFLAHVDRAVEPEQAQAVAVATPCWPAPVSAITRFLPMRRASSPWPIALLILWAPVWFRSSRFR